MREPPLRQRYTAMLRQLMRSRIHSGLTRFANGRCGMLAHLTAYGCSGPACHCRHPSAGRIARKNRGLPDLPASPGARSSVAGGTTRKSRCWARRAAQPPDTSEKSRLPGALRSGAPAKVLVFMQLFRLPPHYVMRCGPIDLVTMSPWRLR